MTFTVLARDPRRGLIGAATASRSLAVGNAVISVRPGVGAVASQAWTNRTLRGRLLDALTGGASAWDAVARVEEWDARASLRQVALLPIRGAGAARSGNETSAWAGHRIGEDVVVAGNLLTGGDVLEAMIARVERDAAVPLGTTPPSVAPAEFARALVAALAAGEERGGDLRGRQSAAVVVAQSGVDGDVRVDLRVDDHADPVRELARLVEVRARDLGERISARTE